MAMPYAFLDGGTFTLNATGGIVGVNVQCNGVPDYIICKSLPDYVVSANGTGWGAKSNASALQWEWERSMGNGFAFGMLQSSEGSTPQLPALSAYRLPATSNVAVDAIFSFDTSNPPTFAALAGTAITTNSGGPSWIVSMANTGTIGVGDYVRLLSPAGTAQIGGYSFQVTAVTVNTSITLGYAATSGLQLAANTTTVNVLKFYPGRFYPRERRILVIVPGATTKIYFGQQNDFTVGENVYIRVPTKITTANNGWGTQELNNQVGLVTTVTNTATESSIVVSINSSGYSAFQFPTTAVGAAGISPAVVGPSSSGVVPNQQPPGTNLLDTFDNRNVNLIRFGTALFNVASHASSNNDVWMWQSFKYDSYSSSTITL